MRVATLAILSNLLRVVQYQVIIYLFFFYSSGYVFLFLRWRQTTLHHIRIEYALQAAKTISNIA